MPVQLFISHPSEGSAAAGGVAVERSAYASLSDAFSRVEAAYLGQEKALFWVDLEDPTPEDLEVLEARFGFHSAAIRDLQQESKLPKLTSYPGYSFILLHRIFYRFETQECESRNVAVFQAENWILTVHRSNLARTFRAVHELVELEPRTFLAQGTGMILLHVLEGVVNDYRPIINQWEEDLESLEEQIFRGSQDPVTEKILRFKKLVVVMRKNLLPQKSVLVQVYERLRSGPEDELIRPFLKNVVDEMSAVLHDLEALSAHAASVFDIYAANLSLEMTKSSHQLNTVMQRLNVMTAIFLPLTFIVGVYGMNIEGIPELKWKDFYFVLWGVMVTIVALLLYLFKKFRWY